MMLPRVFGQAFGSRFPGTLVNAQLSDRRKMLRGLGLISCLAGKRPSATAPARESPLYLTAATRDNTEHQAEY